MATLCKLIWCAVVGQLRSRASLQAELLVTRHQLNVLRRKSPQRITFSGFDRLVFAGLYALVPGVLDALRIVKPDTVIRWHRAGFRAYWRWQSRSQGGRPRTPTEIRRLIRAMSIANPLWGAPRIPRRIAQARDRCRPFANPKWPEKAIGVTEYVLRVRDVGLVQERHVTAWALAEIAAII